MSITYAQVIDAVVEEVKSLLDSVQPAEVQCFVASLVGAKRIFFTAAGRSRLMLSGMAMRLMHIGLAVHVVGEVTAPAIGPGDLLVAASGSGETTTIVNIAQKAKAAGARVAVVTLQAEATLGRLSDVCVTFSAQQGRPSIQIGAAAFEQATLLLGDTLVWLTAQKLDISNPNEQMNRLHSNLE